MRNYFFKFIDEIFRVRRQWYPGTCSFARGINWKWFTGYQWQPYDVETSNCIEDAFQMKSNKIDLKHSPIRIPNIVHFSTMEQVNKRTKKSRQIQRDETKDRYPRMDFETANGVAQHDVTVARHCTRKLPSATATRSNQSSAKRPDSAAAQDHKVAVPTSVGTKVIVYPSTSATQRVTQSYFPLASSASNHTVTSNGNNIPALQPRHGLIDLNSSLNPSRLSSFPTIDSPRSNMPQHGYSLNSTVPNSIPSLNQNGVAINGLTNPMHRTSVQFPVGSTRSTGFVRPQSRMQTNCSNLNGGTSDSPALWAQESSGTSAASGSDGKPRKKARSANASSTRRRPPSKHRIDHSAIKLYSKLGEFIGTAGKCIPKIVRWESLVAMY